MRVQEFEIRNAKASEFKEIGQLLVAVYSQIEGFPKASDQPDYYHNLANVGSWTEKPGTELLVAVAPNHNVLGAVVYFDDMKYYGSGGTAPNETDAAGFRLLAVDPTGRGKGVGKQLSLACIEKAKRSPRSQVIIHSTKAMQVAWAMYQKLGFERSEALDFMQGDLPVYGFRLILKTF